VEENTVGPGCQKRGRSARKAAWRRQRSAAARQQIQQPKTAGQKADPTEKSAQLSPDIVVVEVYPPSCSEARHAAARLHVVANRVAPLQRIADCALERSAEILIH